MTEGSNSANERLKSICDRVERIEEERKNLAADIRDIMSEAKSLGFDPKIIRKALRLRSMETEKRREEQELLDLYLAALGILD